MWKRLTLLSLYNDLLCLFSQQTLKFSDTGSTAIIHHLVLPNLLDLSDPDARRRLGYMQHHTQFHLIQMPSTPYSVSPLKIAPAGAEVCLLEIYSISFCSPFHHAFHPPKTQSSR